MMFLVGNLFCLYGNQQDCWKCGEFIDLDFTDILICDHHIRQHTLLIKMDRESSVIFVLKAYLFYVRQ